MAADATDAKKGEAVAVDEAALRRAEALDAEGTERSGPELVLSALYWFCIAYALFHFAVLNYVAIDEWLYRVLHVNMAAIVVVLAYRGLSRESGRRVPLRDWALALVAIGCTLYIAREYDQLIMRSGVITTAADFAVGVAGTILVVEIARRTSGLVLPIVALVFLAYVFVGPWLPGVFRHGGFPAPNVFSL